MDAETRISFIRTLSLVWEHQLDPFEALRYLELVKEPHPRVVEHSNRPALHEVLDRIAEADQAGRLHRLDDGRPSAQAVQRELAMSPARSNHYWHAYSVERLGLAPFLPPEPDDDAPNGSTPLRAPAS